MILSPDTLRRLISSRYLGPLTLALAVAGLAVNEIGYQSLERLSEQNALILEARTLADQVRLTALMMESAKRGYILTERDVYLEPYTEHRDEPAVRAASRARAGDVAALPGAT